MGVGRGWSDLQKRSRVCGLGKGEERSGWALTENANFTIKMLPCYGQEQARAEQPKPDGRACHPKRRSNGQPTIQGSARSQAAASPDQERRAPDPQNNTMQGANSWEQLAAVWQLFGFCLSRFVRLARCLGLLLALPDACDIADGKKGLAARLALLVLGLGDDL